MDYKYLGKDITPESLKAMKPEACSAVFRVKRQDHKNGSR